MFPSVGNLSSIDSRIKSILRNKLNVVVYGRSAVCAFIVIGEGRRGNERLKE